MSAEQEHQTEQQEQQEQHEGASTVQAQPQDSVYVTPRFCIRCGDRHTTESTVCEACYTPPTITCRMCKTEIVPEIPGEEHCGPCLLVITNVVTSPLFERMVDARVDARLAEREREEAPAIEVPLRCVHCSAVYKVPLEQAEWRQVCGPCFGAGIRPPPKPRTAKPTFATTKRMRL